MKQEKTTPSINPFGGFGAGYGDGFSNEFDESLRVEETKTMETEYVDSGSRKSNRPVIQSSTPKLSQHSAMDE